MSGMEFEAIQYQNEGSLAWITLDRPDKLNAINAAMVAELNQALDRAEADDSVRVILLKGAGRAFSAGFDLEDSEAGNDPERTRAELQADFDLIMRFWHSPKPTIAAVHGYCLGSAMEMALACDITLATDDARLGAPEVRFGSGIVALVLPWLCGPKKAKEWLLTGNDRITAAEAEQWGLVNRVFAGDRLEAQARALALEIAGNDQLAVRMTKQAINRSCEVAGMDEALRQALEVDIEVELTETEESKAFNRILQAEGARAAIAWRRKQAG
jgi:enoyl-CoA hydratase